MCLWLVLNSWQASCLYLLIAGMEGENQLLRAKNPLLSQ